jgi:hypothetical protein
MPRTFAQFKNRLRTVEVFPEPDGLAVQYRPEAIDDAWRRRNRDVARGAAGRARELDILAQKLAKTEAGTAAHDRIAAEYDRLSAEDDDLQAQESADMLLSLVAGWDLFEDEACTVPMPVTRDALQQLGAMTLKRIADAVMEDMTGTNPRNAPPSTNGSHPGASAATVPTGTSLSR